MVTSRLRSGAFLSAWLSVAGLAQANVVLEWDALMLDAIRTEDIAPTLATRNLAILDLAMFDAVNGITKTHQSYRLQVPAPVPCSIDAAAVAAACQVMKSLFPAQNARTDSLYEQFRLAALQDEALTNGLAFGRQVGLQAVESRVDDGSSTEVPYLPESAPGAWRRTPPFFRPPVDPHWRYVRPFAIGVVEPFLPPPPPPLGSADYSQALNEVRSLGSLASQVRTAEQGTIARFWSDFSFTVTPPGHWHQIAAFLANQRGLSVPETARLLALLSLAQADAAIVCWEAKYRFNFWRPVTAIARADEDGNPDTAADPGWQSFLSAPSFPEHPSGHSTFSKASASVLTSFFGEDRLSFTVGSDSLPGVFRTYQSLSGCAEEIGRSRIYGGIHFETANRAGKFCGARVARYVTENYLLPLDQLPALHWERGGGTTLWLVVHGRVGERFVLDYSTDLRTWTPWLTNAGALGGLAIDPPLDAAGRACFYRVVQ